MYSPGWRRRKASWKERRSADTWQSSRQKGTASRDSWCRMENLMFAWIASVNRLSVRMVQTALLPTGREAEGAESSRVKEAGKNSASCRNPKSGARSLARAGAGGKAGGLGGWGAGGLGAL